MDTCMDDIVNLPEVQYSFATCLMLPKGKVLSVYFKYFLQIWVHFPLKDQANYIRHNSTITPLYLLG